MCHFMEPENKNILLEGAKVFGIYINDTVLETFDFYLKELLKWNQKINLSAIRSEQGIVLKHFLDSLSPYPHLPPSSSLLDIGSGAGFPGIPLKIVQPAFKVTLIDSVLKKVDFQKHILRRLGLKGIEAVHGRAQDNGLLQRFEGRFDIVISRAFSDLQTFLALSFPFLKKGGVAVAMKGGKESDKIQSLSEKEISPYRLERTVSLNLPFSAFKRTILLFKKITLYDIK